MPDETDPPLSDNAALNRMVDELIAINDFLAEKYDRVQGDGVFVLVDPTHPYLRGGKANAVKTVVTNKGPDQCFVKENGVNCLIVPADTSLELPMAGLGSINITVAASTTANIAVSTYTKD